MITRFRSISIHRILRRFGCTSDGRQGCGGSHPHQLSPATQTSALQSGASLAALAPSPKGHDPLGAFEHTAPLTQTAPLLGEVEGAYGPSQRLPVARGWDRIKRLNARLEDSWLGDLLALICLAGCIYMFLVIGWVLQ